jgi:CheY-like chemotaxis protein
VSEHIVKHILLVEDSPASQEIVRLLLESCGARCTTVGDAEAALMLLEHALFDGFIIDLALPNSDGLSLLRAIRAMPALVDVPIITFTAYHSSLMRKDALALGSDLYISKPFNEHIFIDQIRRLFRL